MGIWGWQEAFIFTGAIGFIWLVAWRFYYQKPADQKKLSKQEFDYIHSDNVTEEAPEEKANISWAKLFTLKPTWAFIVGKFFTDPIWYFFLFWLPSYFSSTFHLDLKKPSLPLVIVYTAATVGAIGGGYLSTWLMKKGWLVFKARKMALFVSALCVLPIIASRYTTDMWVVIGLISLAVAGNAAWSANIYTIVSDMLPRKAVSSVIGIGGMAGAIGGILFPILVGSLLDTYKAAGNITAGYNLLFTICGFTYLVALTIIHLLTRKVEKVKLSELF